MPETWPSLPCKPGTKPDSLHTHPQSNTNSHPPLSHNTAKAETSYGGEGNEPEDALGHAGVFINDRSWLPHHGSIHRQSPIVKEKTQSPGQAAKSAIMYKAALYTQRYKGWNHLAPDNPLKMKRGGWEGA